MLLEAVIGGLGALVILLFVFGTLPAVLMPIVVAVAAILNTFTLVWGADLHHERLDHRAVPDRARRARRRDRLRAADDLPLPRRAARGRGRRDGARRDDDARRTLGDRLRLDGRGRPAVAVILPLPFIRSMGIGGMLIPAVSVLAAITLLPAMLAVLGERINSVRVMPKRFVDRGHPEDGAWGRWARFVLRRPWPVAIVGIAIVAVLAGIGTQLNPNESQLKNFPGTGTAIAGRQMLADAGISPGVMKPFDVLVEHGGNAQAIAAKVRKRRRRRRRRRAGGLAARLELDRRGVPGDRRRGARASRASSTASTPRCRGRTARSAATAAVDRDFVHAIYGNFPYVLAFVADPDADPARARVPLDRAADQGGDPEPGLARRGVRDRRLHLPGGPRLVALEHHARRRRSRRGSR